MFLKLNNLVNEKSNKCNKSRIQKNIFSRTNYKTTVPFYSIISYSTLEIDNNPSSAPEECKVKLSKTIHSGRSIASTL